MLGIDEDEADEWIGREELEDVFLVWPENWQVVNVFLAMSTQWIKTAGPFGIRYEGLNYASLPSVYAGVGVRKKDIPEVFTGLRVMEQAALQVIRRQEEDASEDESEAA